MSGVECDIDYIVYETLGCGLIENNIVKNDVDKLIVAKQRLEALVAESNEFLGKINHQLEPRKIFRCESGFETGSEFEFEEHSEVCDLCDGVHY